jgi:SAM-dependent methyltransferase
MDTSDSCCIVDNVEASRKKYWDANFQEIETPNWIETEEPWIMPWIDRANLPSDAVIFCAGVGDSNIVEALVNRGFKNIIANDISEVALQKIKERHPEETITYLEDDLINPSKLQAYFGKIDLYIDRATLHFFTACPEKDHYFEQMKNLLKPGGYTMLGVFSKENVAKCCGLDLQLWSMQSLQNRLADYSHMDAQEVSFTEINGNIRNYIYQFSQKSI